MVWLLCILVLAAFGFLCALWAVFGWMLPGGSGGIIICRGESGIAESGFIRRFLFLRNLGLLCCPLVVVDLGLSAPERLWLERNCGNVELIESWELVQRLELERNQLDGTGIGDHPGRHRRRGVSEL